MTHVQMANASITLKEMAEAAVAAFKACVMFETMESDVAQQQLEEFEVVVIEESVRGLLLLEDFDFPLDDKALPVVLSWCWAWGMLGSFDGRKFLDMKGQYPIDTVATALLADPAIEQWFNEDLEKFRFERVADVARWAMTNVANGMYVGRRLDATWAK